MNKKGKYWLVGFIILALTLTAYHFYAASQAEQQIAQLIEQQTAQTGSISVQYSDIDVTPFTGKVIFTDVTIILGNHIERAKQLTVDLAYLDVLKFYLGGTNYALEHLYQAKALLVKPSYVNKSTLQQISADSLHMDFQGEMRDAIRAAVGDTAFGHDQQITAKGSNLNLQLPKTLITKFKAQQFNYTGAVTAGNKKFWQQGTHSLSMDSLTWTPLKSFQETYGFFLQGFGYKTDGIPFHSLSFRSNPQPQPNTFQVHSELKSELALISADGSVKLQEPMGSSKLEGAKITITDFSPSFKRVLANIEKLLSISLPRNDQGIVIQVEGTVANPKIAQ